MHISPKEHFWTFLPELGQDYKYCDRCGLVISSTGKRLSYWKAIREIADIAEPGIDHSKTPYAIILRIAQNFNGA